VRCGLAAGPWKAVSSDDRLRTAADRMGATTDAVLHREYGKLQGYYVSGRDTVSDPRWTEVSAAQKSDETFWQQRPLTRAEKARSWKKTIGAQEACDLALEGGSPKDPVKGEGAPSEEREKDGIAGQY